MSHVEDKCVLVCFFAIFSGVKGAVKGEGKAVQITGTRGPTVLRMFLSFVILSYVVMCRVDGTFGQRSSCVRRFFFVS